ncbi:MAG TPA: potassium-transporting ATPase subunit F [Thermoplasmata archaeon]|nr:potassium-transporting ATPase subunit F [Thermoplasmata archaeon]
MTFWGGLEANLGLAVFTGLAFALVLYLAYSMLHPERF